MASHTERKLYHAARGEARRHVDDKPPPNVSAAEALQWLLNRLTDQLKYAAHEVDRLPLDELERMSPVGPIPHFWVRVESRLASELASLAVNVERVGLAERMVSIQEARAALILQALTAAAAEAGIPRHQLKELGPAFRRHLTALQGGGEGGAGAAVAA